MQSFASEAAFGMMMCMQVEEHELLSSQESSDSPVSALTAWPLTEELRLGHLQQGA